MDASEEIANRFLLDQGFAAIVHEPDGKRPPDFPLETMSLLRSGASIKTIKQANQPEGWKRTLGRYGIA
jgi:hypothetical protein